MKKILFVVTLILAFTMLNAYAQEKQGTQEKCPIMGGKINEEVFVDYNDMRIFFCCAGCDAEFMKDPEKHIAEMKADGVEILKLEPQSVCPVSGKELQNKEVFVDVEGKRVYTCCENCITAVKADPEKYMLVIAERGEYLEEADTEENTKEKK